MRQQLVYYFSSITKKNFSGSNVDRTIANACFVIPTKIAPPPCTQRTNRSLHRLRPLAILAAKLQILFVFRHPKQKKVTKYLRTDYKEHLRRTQGGAKECQTIPGDFGISWSSTPMLCLCYAYVTFHTRLVKPLLERKLAEKPQKTWNFQK